MSNFIGGMINNHLYPVFYFKFPLLVRLHHIVTSLTTLRNWYVKSELSGIIRNISGSFILYDAGCGAGDFILPLLKKYKDSLFLGADKLHGNVQLCNSYLYNSKLLNGKFFQENIESFILTPHKADIAICITVLQYCSDDKTVLNNLFMSLKPGGTLLLYVPVNYERVFSWSDRLAGLTKSSDYDTNLGLQRKYSTNEIRTKVISAGFCITKEIAAYKTPGKISFELFTGLLNIIKASPWLLSLFIFPLLIIFYPAILLFMILDLFTSGNDGNGIMVIATRKG